MISSDVGVTALPVGKGDLLSPAKVKVHINYAITRQKDTFKVVLCIDSECTDINVTKTRIEGLAREMVTLFRSLSVKAVVVDHSLEGWLLCDRQGVAEFLGITLRRLLRYGDPDQECRPADLMGKVFLRAGKDFVKAEALADLARRIDHDQLARLNPTFKEFQLAILEN